MEVVTDRLPPIDIPEGRLFCQPSRIANIYKASIEEVVQPRDTIAAETVKLSIAHRRTLPYPQILQVGPGAKARTMLESALRGSTAHLGERLVYDARHIDNNNMAHLIQHHMSALGYIKQKLGHGKNDVTVLLDTKPPALALKVFAELGYEIHCTNRSVSANVVTVEIGEFFQLLPYVRSVEVSGWLTDTPGKIFVSRRESRRLINENEVEALLREHGFEKVYFAWAGGLEVGQKHYYRVHGPTFLIEYDNSQNDGNHIHSIWRDLERDFGGDLLRKHLAQHKH